MEYKEIVKESFVIVGYSAAGKWGGDVVHPIPQLWEKSQKFITDYQVDRIIGICLPPRSDDYFYTCGMEIESVDFSKIEKGMTIHTFPAQKYVLFKHTGHVKRIPNTYGEIWKVFDAEGYKIKKGMPEIEVVHSNLFGKEQTNDYEMEIWIPVEFDCTM